MTNPTPKAPNNRGQGRKPLNATGEVMRPRQIRMTDAEWEKCRQLGGAAWIRQCIKKAKTNRAGYYDQAELDAARQRGIAIAAGLKVE